MISHGVSPDPLGPTTRRWTLMDAGRARALAERLHHGQCDPGGARLIEHVRRVAATVAPDARVVAWLHETLEHTSISEETLLAEGLSMRELRAIRLLTHPNIARANASYLTHIEMLTKARGPGADLARKVKRADLADRRVNPAVRPDGWSPPYERGLHVLQHAASHPGVAVFLSGRRSSVTRGGSLDLPRTDTEFRAERLGIALRGLAAELVDERRKVAEMRREIAMLRMQLASFTSAVPDDGVLPGGAAGQKT